MSFLMRPPSGTRNRFLSISFLVGERSGSLCMTMMSSCVCFTPIAPPYSQGVRIRILPLTASSAMPVFDPDEEKRAF